MAAANDGLRFLLELCVLVALGWWGFPTGGAATRWVLALGAPLAAAVVWALFVAPRASLAIADPLRLVLELAVFGAGVAALAGVGRPRAGLRGRRRGPPRAHVRSRAEELSRAAAILCP